MAGTQSREVEVWWDCAEKVASLSLAVGKIAEKSLQSAESLTSSCLGFPKP